MRCPFESHCDYPHSYAGHLFWHRFLAGTAGWESRLRAGGTAGLTLEAWLKRLADAEGETPAEHPLRTAADIVLDCMRYVPPDIMATLPRDGAAQHDHYIYGWPKRET